MVHIIFAVYFVIATLLAYSLNQTTICPVCIWIRKIYISTAIILCISIIFKTKKFTSTKITITLSLIALAAHLYAIYRRYAGYGCPVVNYADKIIANNGEILMPNLCNYDILGIDVNIYASISIVLMILFCLIFVKK